MEYSHEELFKVMYEAEKPSAATVESVWNTTVSVPSMDVMVGGNAVPQYLEPKQSLKLRPEGLFTPK